MITIHTDGASRGNPGRAGIGIVIDRGIFHHEYLGIKTNNQAEYTAILRAYELLEKHNLNEELHFKLDSELAVKQLKGEYKVKNKEIKIIYDKIKEKEKSYKKVKYEWIPRHKNQAADALANEGIDTN